VITTSSLFAYSDRPHARRHGPRGYKAYQQYKPWLRDEFGFRCVYCLFRERWDPEGKAGFSIDHTMPLSLDPNRICDYDNLLFACSMCNSFKQDLLLPDPCATAFAEHLRVNDDGTIAAIGSIGKRIVRVLQLDRLNEWRARLYRVLARLAPFELSTTVELQSWFGYPDDLPDLRKLQPPEGNIRPEGIAQSYFERRIRGELSAYY
jgi:hypothetical protein